MTEIMFELILKYICPESFPILAEYEHVKLIERCKYVCS